MARANQRVFLGASALCVAIETIRQISHSGSRKTRNDLEALRIKFVNDVVANANIHCVDPRLGLPAPRTLNNMDQTSIYCNLGCRSTVDFVGVNRVASITSGSESYRCTLSITIASDGRICPPQFVFKGELGGNVDHEVNSCCDPSIAQQGAKPSICPLHWLS